MRLSPQRMLCQESQPQLAGQLEKSGAQRWSHGGVARKPHPCRGARADRKGRELPCPPRKLTPQRSPGAPRKQRRFAPPPPPRRPKDRAGAGRELRMRARWQCPPGRLVSPAPEVKSLPGSALPWGEGKWGKETASASGARVPDRRMGRMVCGGCTYSRRRCRRLRCCRRRLETPHPSACSRETRSLGGAWGMGRPPPPNRRPSFLQLHQPSTLPSASALLLNLERPANRAAAS